MKNYLLTFFLLWISLGMQISMGQKKDKKKDKKPKLETSITEKKDSLKPEKMLHFKEINTYPRGYFRDNDAYRKIKTLDNIKDINDKKEVKAAYDHLHNYVRRFGPKNFREDNILLWELGRLAEQLGYYQRAITLYGLTLKHNPRIRYRPAEGAPYTLYYDSTATKFFEHKHPYQMRYDSLTKFNRNYYVPIEYYYNNFNNAIPIDTLDIPESVYTDIGDSVNSKFNDYGPTLSNNDLILIFSSQRNQIRRGHRILANEDLFYSRRADSLYITETEQGSRMDTLPWTEARPFVGLNTEYNEGSACINQQEDIIFFARCDDPNGYGDCDLYMSQKKGDGTWSEGQNLGIGINSVGWDSHPALSHTEDTLYFASDRLGGFGMSDIYYTYKTQEEYEVNRETGDTTWFFKWAPAQNIGPVINTRYHEVSPFYHPIYNVLYFSSNGQLVNFGNFDIYKTYFNKYQKWTEPINIGPLVNYRNDEYYFAIDSRAANLYYAKTIKVKVFDYIKGDTIHREVLNLHTATLPMEAQPTATAKFEGVLKDSLTGEPIEGRGIISIIDLDNGIEVAPKYLRPDGSFRFDLIRDNNYLIIITGEDFFRIEQEFLLKGDTTISISTPSMRFKKWKFRAIEFDQNSSLIKPGMKPDLDKLVFFMTDHPNLGLRISGHTDSQGDSGANRRLSQDRANAIKEYLVGEGCNPDQITAIGYGNTRPIVENESTDEDRRINRRVEFEILKLK